MRNKKLPHINRNISASPLIAILTASRWVFLLAAISINLYSSANLTPSYWNELNSVLASPTNQNLVILAQKYWGLGYDGRPQLNLAKDRSSVLGISTEAQELSEQWENEFDRANKDYGFWKNIVEARPDWRDAELALAHAAYRLGKFTEARLAVNNVLSLDPNSISGQKLLELLSNK